MIITATDDTDPVMTAKHITTNVSAFTILVTHRQTYEGQRSHVSQHTMIFPFPAHYYKLQRCYGLEARNLALAFAS